MSEVPVAILYSQDYVPEFIRSQKESEAIRLANKARTIRIKRARRKRILLLLALTAAATIAARLWSNPSRDILHGHPGIFSIEKRLAQVEKDQLHNANTYAACWVETNNRIKRVENSIPKPFLPDPRFSR